MPEMLPNAYFEISFALAVTFQIN